MTNIHLGFHVSRQCLLRVMLPFIFIIVLAVDWERPTIQELHILMIHHYSAAVISVLLWSIGCGMAPQVQYMVLQMFKNFRTYSHLWSTVKPTFKWLRKTTTSPHLPGLPGVHYLISCNSFNLFFIVLFNVVKELGNVL